MLLLLSVSNITLNKNTNGESYNNLLDERTDMMESEEEIRKKRGQPRQKEERGNKEWEDDKSFTLIDIWSRIEQLKHPKYDLHDEKMKSIDKIKAILHENRIEVTVKQIMHKIHSLRNYYSAERCKEEAASKKSGSGRDGLYTSK